MPGSEGTEALGNVEVPRSALMKRLYMVISDKARFVAKKGQFWLVDEDELKATAISNMVRTIGSSQTVVENEMAYSNRILHNTAKTLQAQALKRAESHAPFETGQAALFSSSQPAPDELTESYRTRRRVWETISALKASHREVLIPDMYGCTNKEIGELLGGMPTSTVHSRVQRANAEFGRLYRKKFSSFLTVPLAQALESGGEHAFFTALTSDSRASIQQAGAWSACLGVGNENFLHALSAVALPLPITDDDRDALTTLVMLAILKGRFLPFCHWVKTGLDSDRDATLARLKLQVPKHLRSEGANLFHLRLRVALADMLPRTVERWIPVVRTLAALPRDERLGAAVQRELEPYWHPAIPSPKVRWRAFCDNAADLARIYANRSRDADRTCDEDGHWPQWIPVPVQA